MKKLLFMLGIAYGTLGCGADISPANETTPQQYCFTDDTGKEICSSEFKKAWLDAFYSDCITTCAVCTTWANACGIEKYNEAECLQNFWDWSVKNAECVAYTENVNKQISTNDCAKDMGCRLTYMDYTL